MPALVACSLVMFAGGDRRDLARSAPNPEPPDRDLTADDAVQPETIVEPDPLEAIVPPESFSVRFLVDPGPMPYTVLGATPAQSFSVARLVDADVKDGQVFGPPVQSASLPQADRHWDDRIRSVPASGNRAPSSLSSSPQMPPAISPPERWPESASASAARSQTTQYRKTQLSDIQDHWAKQPIQTLAAQGIVQGFPDRRFRPDDPATPAQLAALLHRAFPKGRIGLASPLEDRALLRFSPQAERPMNRLQVLIAILDRLTLSAAAVANEIDRDFQVTDRMPETVSELIQTATAHRLIAGFPQTGHLDLTRTATRAEVAVLIYRALALAWPPRRGIADQNPLSSGTVSSLSLF